MHVKEKGARRSVEGNAGFSLSKRRNGYSTHSGISGQALTGSSMNSPAEHRRAFQRALGNQAVQRLQTKLKVGPPSDRYEEEADRVAGAIVGMPDATPLTGSDVAHSIPAVRRLAKSIVQDPPDASTGIDISEIRSEQGHAMPDPVRSYFEPRFGRNFGDVRLHTDARAAALSQSLHARAFTVGRDVFFGAGEYAPGTVDGKRLIAHELTHVLQQTETPAAIQRKIKFESPAPETHTRINPIERILGKLPVALTTPTVNGVSFPSNFMQAGEILFQALQPKTAGYDAKTKECSFGDFDVTVSASIINPTAPGEQGWSMNLPGTGTGVASCANKKSVPVTMIGKPDHEAVKKWIEANEQEHVDDLKKLYEKYIKPHFDWLMALRVKSEDGTKCGEVLIKALGNKDAVAIQDFLKDLVDAVKKRDDGGKHTLDNKINVKKDCSSIAIESTKK